MKKMMESMLLVCLLALANGAQAEEAESPQLTKIGINALSLIALGDVNLFYERTLRKYFSTTATVHYVGTTDMVKAEGKGFRFSGGVRAYETQNLQDVFLETKLGISYYTDENEVDVAQANAPLSVEFYAGFSKRLNEMVFFDVKVGVIRFLKSGNIMPSGAFNVGVIY